MQRKKRNLLTLGAIGLALTLFAILGVVHTQTSKNTIALGQDIPLREEGLPSIGGAFELVDKNGKVWKDRDFKGKPMLIYFGYTYCPDICPTALYHMTDALQALGDQKAIQPIFITVDPDRDTPALLQAFGENFHKDFILLTGSKAQVQQAMKAYRVYAARASEGEADEDEDYLIDHSSLIYLMDKDGHYQSHFDHNTPSEQMIKKISAFLSGKK